jgi:DnaJ-class molecular chaperone
MGPMIQQIQRPCEICRGTGKNININKCNFCDDGYKTKEISIKIPLKKEFSNGQQLTLPNHGHQFKNEKTDLIIIINEKIHPIFKRHNNDLCIDIELKLFQAIYGFEKIIKHLDNRELHISYNGKTEFGTFKKIPNEGMKNGDLYIKFTFKLPLLDNIEVSSKLLYLLKILDQDEANNEIIIKNSDTKYIKTIIFNTHEDPFNKKNDNDNNNDNHQPQFHQHQQQCQQM